MKKFLIECADESLHLASADELLKVIVRLVNCYGVVTIYNAIYDEESQGYFPGSRVEGGVN